MSRVTLSRSGKIWTASARRLVSRFNRSMGLFNQSLHQCSGGHVGERRQVGLGLGEHGGDFVVIGAEAVGSVGNRAGAVADRACGSEVAFLRLLQYQKGPRCLTEETAAFSQAIGALMAAFPSPRSST